MGMPFLILSSFSATSALCFGFSGGSPAARSRSLAAQWPRGALRRPAIVSDSEEGGSTMLRKLSAAR